MLYEQTSEQIYHFLWNARAIWTFYFRENRMCTYHPAMKLYLTRGFLHEKWRRARYKRKVEMTNFPLYSLEKIREAIKHFLPHCLCVWLSHTHMHADTHWGKVCFYFTLIIYLGSPLSSPPLRHRIFLHCIADRKWVPGQMTVKSMHSEVM